jgi:hypothetical protein
MGLGLIKIDTVIGKQIILEKPPVYNYNKWMGTTLYIPLSLVSFQLAH